MRPLTRYAWLSIAAAVTTIGLKAGAYLLTGSVGLLSDALESVVNLVAGVVALVALRVAARPPDPSHEFGHGKAEYFSAVAEATMILGAAGAIVVTATQRLLHPRALQQVGVGLAVSMVAAGVNLAVALVLRAAGRRHRSLTLAADARHLLTDVWTSVGVLAGVVLVAATGFERLDPIVALAVGANIVLAGGTLVRHSVRGLMDAALPAEDRAALDAVLARFSAETGVQYHALRTRESGARRFVSLHVLVPGEWTVQQGHDLAERLEQELVAALPGATAFTHVEPVEDPASWSDVTLDRRPGDSAHPVVGTAGGMGDERVDARAAELLPEERAAGSDDPEAQAAAVLAESDERQADRGAAPHGVLERRSSEETVEGR